MSKDMSKDEKNLNDGNFNWYVLQTYSSFETYVIEALKKRIAITKSEDLFGEILLPKEKVVEMKKGQKKTSERKYFPGYVLICMVMNERTWQIVRSIPKIIGFVGGTEENYGTPISKKEVEEILNRLESGVDKPKPKVVYEAGQVVRIIDGPFSDFNGVVEEVNYEKNKLRVAVLIFGRSTPVDFNFDQVEKG